MIGFQSFVQEGVFDPGIFKAIFLAGGPGSGKSYQPNYSMDHVTPGTYIEPGLGQPEGTERGIFGTQGTGDGGTTGERWR